MATQLLKEEEQNLIKISYLNLKYSPIVVRQFFDRNIPPNQLAQVINHHMLCITGLIKKKRITAPQADILRRIPGTVWPPTASTSAALTVSTSAAHTSGTTSKDFDLTLMICLLRNIGSVTAPISGWDQLPNTNDKTDGAYLAGLKFYRNKLAHTTESSIPTHEFKHIWTFIVEALLHFNGGQAIAEVNDLFNQDFDNTTMRLELESLKQQYVLCESEKLEAVLEIAHYKIGHLPKNVEDNLNTVVKLWTADDEVFYETRGTEAIYNKIKSTNLVTVTGNSGSGKTAAIRHIARKFQCEGYQIIPVDSPDKLIEYRRNAKQFFLVDDVVGKYAALPSLLDSWERQDDIIRKCLKENGETKVLCTLRNQVALHKRFVNLDSVLRENIIDLEEKSISLTNKEKKCILLKHINDKTEGTIISEEDISEICKSCHAFPLLCRLVTSNEEWLKDKVVFFHKPFQVLHLEHQKLHISNKEVYCGLVLCMILNGSIPLTFFHKDNCDDIFFNTTEACGLGKNVSRLTILDSIKTVVGSYITFEENNYKFVHDALLESVSLHFSKVNPHAMFTLCDFSVIRDRVKLQSDLKSADENVTPIPINVEHFEAVAKRILTELQVGNFSNVLMSQVIKQKRFVKCLGQIINDQESTSKEALLYKVSSEVHSYSMTSKLLEELKTKIDKKKKITNKDAITQVIRNGKSKRTLLYWLVAFGCDELFQYFWTNLSGRKQKHFLGRDLLLPYSKPFFPLAVLGGSLNIVKALIQSDADVNCFSEYGTTPLTIAIRSSGFEIVSFLIDNGANVNQFEMFYYTSPCAVSVETGNADVLKLLIIKKADITLLDLYGKSPLTVAILNKKRKLIHILLQHDCKTSDFHSKILTNELNALNCPLQHYNVECKTSFGWTVLHFAVQKDDQIFVRILIDKSYNLVNSLQSTNAQFNCEDETVMLQVERPVSEVNVSDIHGFTPLHLAVIRDNTDIAKMLLLNGSVLNMRDNLGRNPLHYVQSAEMAETLTKLCHKRKCFKLSNENQRTPSSPLHYVQSAEMAVTLTKLGHERKCFKLSNENQRTPSCLSIFREVIVNDICANVFNFPMFQDIFNMQDWDGNTPLHIVTENYKNVGNTTTKEYNNIVCELTRNAANVHLRNNKGLTARHHVGYGPKYQIYKYLMLLIFIELCVFLFYISFHERMTNYNNTISNCSAISKNHSEEAVLKLLSTNTAIVSGIVYFTFVLITTICTLRRFLSLRKLRRHMRVFYMRIVLIQSVPTFIALLTYIYYLLFNSHDVNSEIISWILVLTATYIIRNFFYSSRHAIERNNTIVLVLFLLNFIIILFVFIDFNLPTMLCRHDTFYNISAIANSTLHPENNTCNDLGILEGLRECDIYYSLMVKDGFIVTACYFFFLMAFIFIFYLININYFLYFGFARVYNFFVIKCI